MKQSRTNLRLSDKEVSDRLVAAINNQAAAEVGAEILALPEGAVSDLSRDLATQAVDVTGAISREMLANRNSLVGSLREAGVDAVGVEGAEDRGGLQYYKCTIDVPAQALERALEIAAGAGFRPPIPLDRGRQKILCRTAESVVLVRFDDASTRVALRLSNGRPVRLPGLLRPGMADIAAVRLPSVIWPLYYIVRPFRIVADRMTGRRKPVAESDFLSTPGSMIVPLLECLSLTADDHFVDLGCGDGRVVVEAASRFGCQSLGIESNPAVAALARERLAGSGLVAGQATISESTIELADLSGATVIFMFLPSYQLAKALPAVLLRADPNVRIVTHEQTRLQTVQSPDRSLPIFATEGLTVAHLWLGANVQS